MLADIKMASENAKRKNNQLEMENMTLKEQLGTLQKSIKRSPPVLI